MKIIKSTITLSLVALVAATTIIIVYYNDIEPVSNNLDREIVNRSPSVESLPFRTEIEAWLHDATPPADGSDFAAFVASLEQTIEDWDRYEQSSDVKVGDGECPNRNEILSSIINDANDHPRSVLMLNGALPLVSTENEFGLTDDQFRNFLTETDGFCNVGGIYPVHAYPERLLWAGTCSTGSVPSTNAPSYPEFLRCFVAEEAIRAHFHL